jgi:hypothetical protein
MLLSDPLTSIFGVSGCVLLASTERADSNWRRFAVIGALLIGMIAAAFWPYFSFWDYVLHSFNPESARWLVADQAIGGLERFNTAAWNLLLTEPTLLLTILGPAVLAIPLWIVLLVRREYPFIAYGALVMMMLAALSLAFGVPRAHQLLLFVVIYLQLALVWGILQVFDTWKRPPRPPAARYLIWGTMSVVALVAVFNVVLLVFEFQGYMFSPTHLSLTERKARLPGNKSVGEFYAELTQALPESAVVLTTAQLGWPLPAYRGKVVSLYQDNPLVNDQAQRYKATMNFFYKTMDDQRRTDIIINYHVSHILVSRSDKGIRSSLYDWLDGHAMLLSALDGYQLFEVIESSQDSAVLPAGGVATDPQRLFESEQ